MFTELKASLQVIGLTSLFHLPWNLKFLWGPYLDEYGTKRRWLALAEGVIALGLVGLAFAAELGQAGLLAASAIFAVLAFVSATHDIAIDGYYLEALDEAGQSRYVGLRTAAYRAALLVVAGPALYLIAEAGWFVGFTACAALIGLLGLYHFTFLPHAEQARQPMGRVVRALLRPSVLVALAALGALAWAGRRFVESGEAERTFEALRSIAPGVAEALASISLAGAIGLALLLALFALLLALPTMKRRLDRSDSFYARAFISFLDQPKVGRILAFVVLFRVGESFLQKMRYPFLKELGMSLDEYAFAKGTVGMAAALIGPIVGGWLISRHGLRRWIWPFVLAQNVLNLLYMVLGWYAGAYGAPSTWALGAVIVVEMFGAGLGTAVFMVYLMRCAQKEHRGAHMAILTALMSVGLTVAGASSGFVADAVGFTPYFGFTFLMTIPGMLFIFFIPHVDERPQGTTRK